MQASSQANQNRWNGALRVNVERTGKRDFWRPKPGENLLRVLNFNHKVTAGDLKLGRYSADTPVGTVMDEFFIPFRQHFRGKGQAPSPCGRLYTINGDFLGSCVTCDQADDLRGSDLDADKQAASRIKASNKYAMNIVDLTGTEQKIVVWEAPFTLLGFIQSSKDSTAYRNQELLGVGGRDILVTYNPNAAVAKDMYKCLWMDRDQAKKISASGEVTDLYGSPAYVPPQFQGLVTASAPQSLQKPAAAPAAPKAPTAPKAAPLPPPSVLEDQEGDQQHLVQGGTEPATPKVAAKRGRPKKVEPTVALKYRVGSKVRFVGEDDAGTPEEMDGEITADKDESGNYTVFADGTEYGVTEEEFIK